MKTTKQLIRTLLASALTAAVLAGCGQTGSSPPAARETPLDEQRYTIYSNDYPRTWTWTLDGNGKTVPEAEQYTILYDVLTGEPQCKVLARTEGVGKDEYGNILTRDMSALFDLNGELLYDWSECVYSEGFGDIIVRQNRALLFYEDTLPEGFETALWNFKTGETIVPGVGQLYSTGDGETLLAMDTIYRPLGIIDKAGNKLSGFPAPELYAYAESAWNGYILVNSRPLAAYEDKPSDRYFLLTQDFEELLSHKLIHRGFAGDALWYIDNPDEPNQQGGIITPDGRELLRFGPDEGAYYFDDSVAVVSAGDYNAEDSMRYRLVRLGDGAALSEDYRILQPAIVYSGDRASAERFLGYRDGKLELLDREGKILVQKELADVRYLEYMQAGLWRCSIRPGDQYFDTVLDQELAEIVPSGIYSNVMQATEWEHNEMVCYDVLTGDRLAGDSSPYQRDILDLNGNVLIENIGDIYGVGPNRVAVRKGFDAGLMDWKGNWIVKRSIFTGLMDD